MVGTQKWSMEEILWVFMMAQQGMKDEEIFEIFQKKFKGAKHVTRPSSIKYCRSNFRRDEYTQEKYWEDVPGKIGYVLGRHEAGARDAEIVPAVTRRFPGHQWVPRVQPVAKCIEFVVVKYGKLQQRYSDYTAESTLVNPVLDGAALGESPEDILTAANESGINLDEIYYIIGRFGPQPRFNILSNVSSVHGSRSSGSSASSSRPSAPGKRSASTASGPSIYDLPKKDSLKRRAVSRSHGSALIQEHASSASSQQFHGPQGASIQGQLFSNQQNGQQEQLQSSLLNSSNQVGQSHVDSQFRGQMQGFEGNPQQYAPQPREGYYSQYPAQNGMGFVNPNLAPAYPFPQQTFQQGFYQYPQHLGNMSQGPGYQDAPFSQPDFQQRWVNGYGQPQMQPKMGGPLENVFSNQSMVQGYHGHTQNFGQQLKGDQGDQFVPLIQVSYGQPQNYGNSSQQNESQRQLLCQPEQQQSEIPLSQSNENIDPALLQMDTQFGPPVNSINKDILPVSLSIPQSFSQDTQHGSAINQRQHETDISSLSVSRSQTPTQSQSIPQETPPDALPMSNIGIESNDTAAMRRSDQQDFNQLQMSNEEVDRSMVEQKDLSDNVLNSTNFEIHSLDYLFSLEHLNDAPEPSLDAGEGNSNSDLPREQLPQAEKKTQDTVENAANAGDLLGLFPDINLKNPMNFNFDAGIGPTYGNESFASTGEMEVDTLVPDLSKEWPYDTTSQIEAMETMGRVLETGMAAPFLEQTATASTNLLETPVNEQTTNNYDPKSESFEEYLQQMDWDLALEGLADVMS